MDTTTILFLGLLFCGVTAIVGIWLATDRGPAARTIRRSIVRLPVIQSPTTQRLGVAVGLVPKSCATCEHFDQAAGREVLAKNPAFMGAAQWLSPAQMARSAKGEEVALGDEIAKVTWDQYGACSKHSELRPNTSSCEEWS